MVENKGCPLHGVRWGIQAIAWGEAAATLEAISRIGAMGGHHVTLSCHHAGAGSFQDLAPMRGAKANDVREFHFYGQAFVIVSVSIR